MAQNYAEDYVDVATRLRLALDKYPDLRVQETGRDVLEYGDGLFLVCTVTVWRTPDDPIPVIASAAERAPGLTPFTRNSELMNGYTSALGRCLGYMGFGIEKSIATANEVEPRRQERTADPRRESLGSAATSSAKTTGDYSTQAPTAAQLKFLDVLKYTGEVPATKAAAARLIDELKGGKP